MLDTDYRSREDFAFTPPTAPHSLHLCGMPLTGAGRGRDAGWTVAMLRWCLQLGGDGGQGLCGPRVGARLATQARTNGGNPARAIRTVG
jgi:hypothetical protein